MKHPVLTSWRPDVCSKERLFLFKRGLPRFSTTPFPGSLSTDVALEQQHIFHILNSLTRNQTNYKLKSATSFQIFSIALHSFHPPSSSIL